MTIKQKIISSRGSTMIFALVALLIASMVSAVIIYAAENNLRRAKADQVVQQEMLNLNSVASLIRSEIAGDEFVGAKTTRQTTKTDNTPYGAAVVTKTDEYYSYETNALNGMEEQVQKYKSENGSVDVDNLSAIESMLKTWIPQILEGNTSASYERKLTISANVNGITQDNVIVDLIIQPGGIYLTQTDEQKEAADAEKYYLTAKIYLEDNTISTKTIILTFMASPTTTSSSSKSAERVERDPDDASIEYSVYDLVTTDITTVAWPASNVVVNVIGG